MNNCLTCIWRLSWQIGLIKSLAKHCESCLVERDIHTRLAELSTYSSERVALPSRESSRSIDPELVDEINEIVREL